MNEHILQAIPELEGNIPPETFMASDFRELITCGLGVALVLAGLGIRMMFHRKAKKPQQAALTPQQQAERELDELAEQLPPLRECSLKLSMIIRRFLTAQVNDSAMYETHEEFCHRMDTLSTLPIACRYETRFILERLADMKYCGLTQQDPQQVRVLIEETRGLVTLITKAQEEEAAAAAAIAKVQKL